MNGDSNRKFEFFIGATRRDLNRAIKKLIETVLEANHIPSGMELWSAGTQPLLDEIATHLERCDAHIIVLGARYGEIIPDKGISFTEWEYEQSKDKRPILAFLLNNKEFEKEREKVRAKDPDEAMKEDALRRFREELKKTHFCKFFSNTREGIAELGTLCLNSINQLINSRRLGEDAGWIRASSYDVSVLRQISKNRFLDRELKRLRDFSIVGERVPVDRASKEVQAQVFWERMMGTIRRNGYKTLFFESGSTLAYVSEAFEDFVLKDDPDPGSWCVWSNNVLTVLQLLLYTDVDVRRFPPSAPDPEDKYGAIFPRQWHLIYEPPPLKPRGLYETERAAVERMREELRNFGERTLFLATISGWDLDHALKDFQGPHTGSHPNMLFKRALFTTGRPVVIFFNAEKLGDPFEIGICYSIFGEDEPLGNTLENSPLALCVGYDLKMESPTRRKGLSDEERKKRNDPKRIEEILRSFNFDVTHYPVGDRGAIIAKNSQFKGLLPDD